MQLLTKELKLKIPTLYSQEEVKDPMVICKFFLPFTKWTWYAIEFDEKDTFFGYVDGDYPELGYFTLSELKNIKGPYGLKVERDMYFDPQLLSKVKEMYR